MGMTVGEAALAASKEDLQADYHQMQREILQNGQNGKNFEQQVWEAVDRGRKDPQIEGNFYVVVLFRKERSLKPVVRLQYLYRKSCPTPEYDQTVFYYDREGDHLDFIWTVPNNVTVTQMVSYPENFPEDQQMLVEYAKDFTCGVLEQKAKKLNKEV